MMAPGDTALDSDEEHHEVVLVGDGDNVEVLFLAERARVPIVSSSSSQRRNGPKSQK